MSTAKYVIDRAGDEPEVVGDILRELHERGETADDLVEYLTALEARMVRVEWNEHQPLYDVCGTGGSGQRRVNLSTALAARLAGEGYPVAKHGNKAQSGRIGSFDVVEALGEWVCKTPFDVRKGLDERQLAYVYAPAFHPALRDLGPVRRGLGHPTVFNYLGPLLNPCAPLTAQLIGVSDPRVGQLMAAACREMAINALLVHDTVWGLDDVSPSGVTLGWQVQGGEIVEREIHPSDYGMEVVSDFAQIAGGTTLAEAVTLHQSLLAGDAPAPQQQFFDLNYLVAKEFFDAVG